VTPPPLVGISVHKFVSERLTETKRPIVEETTRGRERGMQGWAQVTRRGARRSETQALTLGTKNTHTRRQLHPRTSTKKGEVVVPGVRRRHINYARPVDKVSSIRPRYARACTYAPCTECHEACMHR
jgi:hypothetical protein